LLPGSRKQEIEKMLPLMLASVADFKDFKIVIAQAPNLDKNIYLPFIENKDIALIQHQTYNILKLAKLAIVTSGTATLETALFQVPQLVCYIANPISYIIAKQLVKVKYISLVNLILDRNAVVELIQNDVTVQNIQQEMKRLLFDETRIQGLKKDYEALKNILHEGNASERTAEIMYQLVLKQ
jgi:lipid-A-disaccharide synthase